MLKNLAIFVMAFFLTNIAFAQVDRQQKEMNALMERYNREIQKLKDQGVFDNDQFKERLKEGLSQKPMVGKLIERFPKILDFFSELFNDKEAIPKLLTLSNDKKRLWNFIYVQLALFVFSFIWRLTYRKKPFFSFDFLFNVLARFIVIMGLRVYSVYYFFGDELAPTYEVFKKVFY